MSVGDSDPPHLPPPPPPISSPPPSPSPSHSHFMISIIVTTPAHTRYLLNGSLQGYNAWFDLDQSFLPPAPVIPHISIFPVPISTGSVGLPSTTIAPSVVLGYSSSESPSTVASLNSNSDQNGEAPSAEELNVCHSHSGCIIMSAMSNVITNTIDVESMQPKLGKHPQYNVISAGRVEWCHC